MSQVVNAPTHQNTGGTHELRVTATPAKDQAKLSNSGMAANVFEGRASQEAGSH
jgi:hypothetical protein